MQDSLEQRLKQYEKRTPDGEVYYWYSDLPSLVGDDTPSMGSFRRRVNEGKIHTVTVEGQEEAAYLASDIQRFLRGELTKKRGGARYGKRQSSKEEQQEGADLASSTPNISKISTTVYKASHTSSLKLPLIDSTQPDDLLHVFVMEYEQVGMNAISLHIAMPWIKKNNEVYWLLSNPVDRKDVWATFCALPLADDVIFQLLRGERSLNEISSESILIYESGKDYSCYLSAVVHPDHQDLLPLLISHVFAHWSKQPFTIKNLYVLSHDKESPVWQKNFYFSPFLEASQVDRGNYAWQLRLDFPNPSIDVQNLKQKQGVNSVVTQLEIPKKSTRNREYARNLRNIHVLGPGGAITDNACFRRTQTDEDIIAILKANETMFGARLSLEERLRLHREWINHNPEVSHVLEYKGKIVGYLTFLPLPMDTINRLLSSEITFWKVNPDEILPYQSDIPMNIFIQTLAVDPAFEKDKETFTRFGSWLLRGVMNMFIEWGKQGIEVSKVFARSDTSYGQYFSIGLGFEEVPAPEGVHKRVFIMDVAQSEKPLPTEYRRALAQYREEHRVNSHVS